jgi:uncharacterized protein YlxW (UPF0749 family)
MRIVQVAPLRWPESQIMDRARTLRLSAGVWVLMALAGWSAVIAIALVALSEHRRAEHTAVLAGMTPAHGPGVEIILADTEGSPPRGRTNQQLVTDEDLIFLNTLLWYAGTRAVAINDQRIVAQSTIVSSGPVVLINGRRLTGPFRITAIGDPNTLKSVLTQGGVLDQMRGAGINVQVAVRQNVEVPAWRPVLVEQ